MENQKKIIHVVAALIRKENEVFATQRGYGNYKDWWEFPGGKIEHGETPEDALVREIREELAAEISVGEYLTTVEYDYPEFHLSMACYWCSVKEGHLTLLEHEAARWLPLGNLRQVNWLPADVLVIEEIEKAMKKEIFSAEAETEKEDPTSTIEPLATPFSICKVKDYSGIDTEQPFIFIGSTDAEKSLVCPMDKVPDNVMIRDDGWRAFRICAEMDFSLIGILAGIAKILAENEIGIFAISTYNTDYILTKEENFGKAVEALRRSGYRILK